jgi:uncharacterized membrane protein
MRRLRAPSAAAVLAAGTGLTALTTAVPAHADTQFCTPFSRPPSWTAGTSRRTSTMTRPR